jgi:5'-nucleotidase
MNFFEVRERGAAFRSTLMRPSVLLPLLICSSLAAGCTIQSPTPDLSGQDVHFTIVHTADLHSRFFPYYFAPGQIDKGLGLQPKTGQTTAVVGGIARVGMIIKCIRGVYSGAACKGLTVPDDNGLEIAGDPAARSLHLDSGDIFEGAPVFNQFNGEVEMRAMSDIGLSAMALGNHEFDKGAQNLEEQIQRFGGFPILAANYVFADPSDPTQPKLRDIIYPYSIFNVDGLKVGVIGMGNLSSLEGIYLGGNNLGIKPLDSVQAIKETAAIVRPQVDLLIIASHLGLDEDEGVSAAAAESTDQNAQIALDGVDVILGGHLHIVLNPPKDLLHLDQNGALVGHTILCHSGAFAKYVGRLDLVVHVASQAERAAGQRSFVKAYTYKLIPVEDSIKADPDLTNLLEPYQFAMDRYLNLNQVYALVACPVNSGTCPKTTRSDPNGGDSQLGNLVATSMRLRKRVEADFALTNSLGIRADFESGPLNLEEMYNVFPFDNTLTTMFLSGNEVQEMLDFVASRSAERGCRTQAQVSGIYFDLECDSNDQECNDRQDKSHLPHGPCAKNIYLGDSCRMPDGTFNGTKCTPLDPFGEYRAAVNDYIANGGSGFSVLQRNTTKFNTGISLRDALVDYIRQLPNRCDPNQFTNVLGVTCKDAQGETYDCTSTCGCHDMLSGPQRFSSQCPAFKACAAQTPSLSPTLYDYSNIPCLDQSIDAHDGRIQALSGGSGSVNMGSM